MSDETHGRPVSEKELRDPAYAKFGKARFYEVTNKPNLMDIYVIRDADGPHKCEYAVWRVPPGEASGLRVQWKPCAEGVKFADIEPAMQRQTLAYA